MRNQTSWQENSLKSESSDFCLNFSCSVILIGIVLGLLLLCVLVSAAVFRTWKTKKREMKTQECLQTVEMEFQFLGSLCQEIVGGSSYDVTLPRCQSIPNMRIF